ncbi:MAG: MBL fold metallo-hydrolase [Acidobacteriota bacterium]|nr:MBL fold metallo-hydrolase [Acidobacteriota bacterium]
MILGDFHIRLVRAGVYHWDGGAVFGVVPKTLWSRLAAPDELNRVPLGFNCYVVETGDHTVLVETGGGDRLDARMLHRLGMPRQLPSLPEILAEVGIEAERIDLVVNTHLHWDHCSGNCILREGRYRPAFPNARYVTQRGERQHAHQRHPRDSVSYRDENYEPLIESGDMQLLDGGCEVAPGIEVRVAPGHNRDMMVVIARSHGQTFCMFSDLIPTEWHVQPTWVAAFDLNPLTAIDEKIKLLTQAAREDWWCGFAHDTGIAFAKISEDKDRFEVYGKIS